MPFQAGAIVSKLTLDRSKFSASVKAVGKQTKTLGGWVKKNAGQFKAMGLAIAAMGTAAIAVFTKMVKKYVEVGDWIDKMSKRTGMSATALSELAYAADISGASLNDVEKGVKRMARTIIDANRGLITYQRAFNAINVDFKALQGMDPEQQFFTIAEAIGELRDSTLQAAAAQEIFGRAGTTLIPLFEEGRAGINALRKDAHRLGIIFDKEAAAKAAKLKDAQTALKKSLQGVSFAIVEGFIPALTTATDSLTDMFVNTKVHAHGMVEAIVGFFTVLVRTISGVGMAWHGMQALIFKGAALLTRSMGQHIYTMAKMSALMEKIPIIGKTWIPITDQLIKVLDTLHFMQEGYNELAEEQINKTADIIEGMEGLLKILDKIAAGAGKTATKLTTTLIPAGREMDEVLKNVVQSAQMVGYIFSKQIPEGAIDTEKVLLHAAAAFQLWQDIPFKIEKNWKDGFDNILANAQHFTSELSYLFNQLAFNQAQRIENEYQQRRAAIEASTMDEAAKTKAIERLEVQTAMKRKKAERSAAKTTKAVAFMEAMVHTASAVAEALPNIPLSILVGLLGAAQAAAIAAQPLPGLARGGRIGERGGIVGEEGPELFFPDRPGEIVPLRDRMGRLTSRAQVIFSPSFYITSLDPQTTREVVREQIGPEMLEMLKNKLLLKEFQNALGV